LTFLLLFSVFSSLVWSQQSEPTPNAAELGVTEQEEDMTDMMLQQSNLTEEEVQKLEEQIKSDPNNLFVRAKLIGFYSHHQFDSDAARKEYVRHAIWLIANHPDIPAAGTPAIEMDPVIDPDGYQEAKRLWLKHVETHDTNTAIIGNAASFFLISDSNLAEQLLKKAQTLEPKNPKWPQQLAHLYRLEFNRQTADSNSNPAIKALEQMEKSLQLSSSEVEKFYMLADLAKNAFDAGDANKAQSYARELIALAPKYSRDWNYGNAIHYGNIVLGRIALRAGNLDAAKKYLLEAGKTPGSPQLNSFGPNMTLANELLEKGEKDVVLQYFGLCAKFWKMGQEKLKDWTALVKGGRSPDFGAQVNY